MHFDSTLGAFRERRPFLSAHADRTHGHKRWLLIATAVGAGASLVLAAVPPAAGFGAGYFGGALALILATAIVTNHDALGLSAPDALRAAFVVMGSWWLLFSLPAALTRMGDGRSADHAATSAGELISFAKALWSGQAGDLGKILLGAVLVLGAVQTAISQFSAFSAESVGEFRPRVTVRQSETTRFLCTLPPASRTLFWRSVV